MTNINIRSSLKALNVHNKGNSVPAWYGDYANKNKWDYDGVPASGNTNGFYHQVQNSVSDVHFYLQYGQNTEGWAGTRFIDQQVVVETQSENADGSINAQGHVNIGPIASYKTDHFIKGVRVEYTVQVNGTTIHHHVGTTGDEYLENPSPNKVAFNTTVQPLQEDDITSVTMDWVYPDGEYPNAHFVLGGALYNPNQPTYTPDTVYNGSSWEINNATGRSNAYYDGSKWVTIAKLPNNKQNQENPTSGHNYYDGSKWLQSPLPK